MKKTTLNQEFRKTDTSLRMRLEREIKEYYLNKEEIAELCQQYGVDPRELKLDAYFKQRRANQEIIRRRDEARKREAAVVKTL